MTVAQIERQEHWHFGGGQGLGNFVTQVCLLQQGVMALEHAAHNSSQVSMAIWSSTGQGRR